MAREQLPFNLPANLSVTQFLGDSGSHARRDALDLAPLISNVTESQRIQLYVNTYARLFLHMKRGALRINAAKTCNHYHYDLRDRDAWLFGKEYYCHETRTFMVNGKPVQRTGCFKCGDITEYTARGPQASTVFLAMLEGVKRGLMSMPPLTGADMVFSALWGVYQDSQTIDQNPTFIYYDEKMISRSNLLKFLENFNSVPVWVPGGNPGAVSPGQSEDITELLILLGFAGLAVAAIASDKTDRNQVNQS